jgi:hypothetical protein
MATSKTIGALVFAVAAITPTHIPEKLESDKQQASFALSLIENLAIGHTRHNQGFK